MVPRRWTKNVLDETAIQALRYGDCIGVGVVEDVRRGQVTGAIPGGRPGAYVRLDDGVGGKIRAGGMAISASGYRLPQSGSVQRGLR